MRLIDADIYLKKICKYEADGCGSCNFQTVCPVHEPTVEAIPIGWLDSYCTDCSIELRDNDAKAIIKLVEDWRQENGKD